MPKMTHTISEGQKMDSRPPHVLLFASHTKNLRAPPSYSVLYLIF